MKAFEVESPCHEPWASMRREGAARFCASCQKHVHDLAELTPSQIRGLSLVTGGRFCARQTLSGGELLTRRDPTRAARWPVRALAAAGILGAAACSAARAEAPDPTGGHPPVVLAGDPTPTPAPTTPAAPAPLLPAPDDDLLGEIAIAHELPTAITFPRGKATLDAQAQRLLADAAAFMQTRMLPVEPLLIMGHAGPDEGKAAASGKLALARATAIRDHLVRLGVDAALLRPSGATPSEDQWPSAKTAPQRAALHRADLRLVPAAPIRP